MPIMYPHHTARKLNIVAYVVAITLLSLISPMGWIVPIAAILLRPAVTAVAPLVLQSKNKLVAYLVGEYNFYVFYSTVKAKLAQKKRKK